MHVHACIWLLLQYLYHLQVLFQIVLLLTAKVQNVDMNSWCVQKKKTVLYTAMTPDHMPVIKLIFIAQAEEEIVILTVVTRMHVYKPAQHALRETAL